MASKRKKAQPPTTLQKLPTMVYLGKISQSTWQYEWRTCDELAKKAQRSKVKPE
ncbi:hypothetical protein MTR67_010353, partial [Solanum verrucosum]